MAVVLKGAPVAKALNERMSFKANELKEQGIEPDYLQVYCLSYSEQEKVLSIRHSQEEPDYENMVSFELPSGAKSYIGKLYYVDDGDHRTMLLAEEY
jgi:hypothetical protein